MDIQKLILQLTNKGLIDPNLIKYKALSGGTSSNIGILRYGENAKYVLKSNETKVIQEEVQFLDYYSEVDLLPKVLYVEPSYQYIVYPFIEGETNYPRKNKAKVLKTLVQTLINNYKPVSDQKGWGWSYDLTASWQEFLISEVEYAKQIIDSNLLRQDDFNMILKLIKSPKRKGSTRQPFLLHGDCGVHNFLFSEEQLCGVIDPMPIVGEPLYDLVFAFCSSPDNLTMETIQTATNYLDLWERNNALLCEEVLIGLYIRFARCTLHHPNDLNEYLKAWNYWKEIVTR
jgi:fructosamine-3-kinase